MTRCQYLMSPFISFLHQTTTRILTALQVSLLSYIYFLHQTTTFPHTLYIDTYCLIFLFYIKPQRCSLSQGRWRNCLISLFYIKPQLLSGCTTTKYIVLYLFSTSNHNQIYLQHTRLIIVLYLFSTSNHNVTPSLR